MESTAPDNPWSMRVANQSIMMSLLPYKAVCSWLRMRGTGGAEIGESDHFCLNVDTFVSYVLATCF